MNQNQDFFETRAKSQIDFLNDWVESKEEFIKYWSESKASLPNTVNDTEESHNIPCTDRYFPAYLNWQY